ncbi:MAG: cell division protein FtsQ/DivIB [Lachnospiraceae bacterium]|nr:cell division protein FtsQ/DivIB [Lachnospiraceae bacterium]
MRFGRSKRLVILASILLVLFFLGTGSYLYIVNNYKVTTVHVEGNIHYTSEEIKDMVMGGRFGDNSIFLTMKYRDKGVDDVPFVETMDVSIEAKDTIRITVYEKALAGYVMYLGRCVYFDKDGIVVETSEEKTEGIPQVTGLAFDYVVLHDKLPVDKPELFEEILNITQQLSKYSLSADRIYFDSSYQVTLYFGEAKVALGENEDIDEKIQKLQYILPSLLGKSGTLDMRVYSEDVKSYSFEQD